MVHCALTRTVDPSLNSLLMGRAGNLSFSRLHIWTAFQAIQRIFQILSEPVLCSFSRALASSKSGLGTMGCGSSPWQLCSVRAKNNLKRPEDGSYEKQSPDALEERQES
ncbi:hypothetical protein EYF80_034201 [Liparis tanakae]|uniref:Uncharacterized protein n=1 Tax=Liparis tanakae TaxID=230148 RepID=A0A4Z2GSL0_9TELE|nr:hypothetical protein EYF80_034201 [Liparis tanakae]